jgi:hypothetical protein
LLRRVSHLSFNVLVHAVYLRGLIGCACLYFSDKSSCPSINCGHVSGQMGHGQGARELDASASGLLIG